jgi:hypothetical protein
MSVMQYGGADGNGNGMIDNGDYTVWRTHFGQVFTPAAGSIMAVDAMSLPPVPKHDKRTRPLKRETQAARSALALDLLLSLDAGCAPFNNECGGLTSDSGDVTETDGVAVDSALDESGRPVSDAVGFGAL